MFHIDVAETVVALTRFLERVDRYSGVFGRINLGDLRGEVAMGAVGMLAHQHIHARTGLGHDEQTAMGKQIDSCARTEHDLHRALHLHTGRHVDEQTVLCEERVQTRHDVAFFSVGMLVLIGGFVVRCAIIVAFEPFGVFRRGTTEGEEMHALGQFDVVGQGHHHIVDDMDGHGGQIRHSTSAVVAGTQSVECAREVGMVFVRENGGSVGIFVAFGLAVGQVYAGKEAPGIVAVRIERRTAVAIDEGALFVKKDGDIVEVRTWGIRLER